VLTPYLRQADLLRGEVSCSVSTVHAFQGREADIVILSLVRDTRRGPRPIDNLGHLVERELVNVALSRARRLLVVVGHFEHFRASGVDHWHKVCWCFGPGRFGRVVDAAEALRR
jgi:superfamily I DNA and/or RNA helicase